MKFGLSTKDLESIVYTLNLTPQVNKAAIFGSRAKGNFTKGSDIDIAIFGEDIDLHTVSRLHFELNELSSMPYFFDVVDYSHLTHAGLKEHIDRVGVTIFSRNKT